MPLHTPDKHLICHWWCGPCKCSRADSDQNTTGQVWYRLTVTGAADFQAVRYQVVKLQGLCFYSVLLLVKKAGSLPRAKHRRFLSDRSWSCAGSNCLSSQLTVWTCSQTSRGHTCPLRVVVPHRSVTRSPSRPKLEAMSRPSLEQVAWPTPQRQQYTSCWALETSRHVWTLGEWHYGPRRLCVDDSNDAPRTFVLLLINSVVVLEELSYVLNFWVCVSCRV